MDHAGLVRRRDRARGFGRDSESRPPPAAGRARCAASASRRRRSSSRRTPGRPASRRSRESCRCWGGRAPTRSAPRLAGAPGIGILRQVDRQELQRDRAAQPRIFRLVDDAHAAGADALEDPVVGDRLANHAGSQDTPAARASGISGSEVPGVPQVPRVPRVRNAEPTELPEPSEPEPSEPTEPSEPGSTPPR